MAMYNQKLNSDGKFKTGLEEIVKYINQGYRVLVLLRGLPGSGKSTLANHILVSTVNYSSITHILSTDDYFKTSEGTYTYDVAKLGDAHSWNQRRANQYMKQGVSPLIIDNTNTEMWEMRAYAESGVANGYLIHILEPNTEWAFKPSILANKNRHGVAFVKIKKMLEKYQSNITASQLFKQFDLMYPPNMIAPIFRLAPELTHKSPTYTSTETVQNRNLNSLPPRLRNGILNKDNNTPKVQSNNINMKKQSKDFCIDLIDFNEPDDWDITDSTKNIQSQINGVENENVCIDLSSDSNDSWTESWAGKDNKNNQPKPQRNNNKYLLKSANHPNAFSNVDWEPIDISLSNRDHGKTSDTALQCNNTSLDLTENHVISCDASTDTQNFDEKNSKILYSRHREINSERSTLSTIFKSKMTLDKGIMTYEEDMEMDDTDENKRFESLAKLKILFDDIPEDYMQDILDKCKGDMNWTVELLLDAKNESKFTDLSEYTPVKKINKSNSQDNVLESQIEKVENKTSKKTGNDSKLNKCMKKDKPSPETSAELKKQIEDNFRFSDDHYSDHSLKLKRKMHGEKCPEKVSEVIDLCETEKRSSESSDDNENTDKTVPFRMGREFFKQLDTFYGTSSAWDDKLEPIIHIPVTLLHQIHALWLESMCNQIDVQREYMKVMIQEDEELARELEAKERQQYSEGKEPNVPNLLGIMDMELALASYNTNASQWNQTNEDLASKLTRQKLCQMFPDINGETLMEIYKAHNSNFEHTFHVLLLNTGKLSPSQTEGADQNIIKKILIDMEKDLLERAKREKEKDLNPDIFNSGDVINVVDDEGNTIELDNKTIVETLRQNAQHHLNIRNLNLVKSREYIANGMVQAALYFSHIAQLHAKKYDYANNLAASRLMQVSTSGHDNYTIDLHHLYVAEAIQVLNMFLDKHINYLRSSASASTVKLYLITGRGKHSPGNQPRIKPAVKRRLDDLGMLYCEVNAGLLGVCVTAQSNIP